MATTKKVVFIQTYLVGPIPDDALLNPSPRLMPLFYQSDSSGIPINMRNTSMECKKQLLLEATIRQAKWVGKHPDSVVISSPPEQEMADNVLSYGLKDLTTLDELEKLLTGKTHHFINHQNNRSIKLKSRAFCMSLSRRTEDFPDRLEEYATMWGTTKSGANYRILNEWEN